MSRTGTNEDARTDEFHGSPASVVPESLRRGFEHLPDPVLLLDADLVIRHVSTQVESLLGWRPDEVVGRTVAAFVAPEDLSLLLGLAASHQPFPGQLRDIEVRVRHRDGSLHVIEISANNLLEDEGVGFLVATLRDVTLAAGRTQELARARDFYLTLLDRFPNPIWRSDTEAAVDYVNHAYLSFTGRGLQDELGDGWSDLLHPDDSERTIDVCYGAYLRRDPFRVEYRLRHQSGEFRWLLDAGEPIYGLEGEFLGYIGSCYDIDDRVKTEEVLRRSQEELVADVDALVQVADERRRVAAAVVEEDDRRAARLADAIENDQLQALAALNIRVALLRERLAGDEVAGTLDPVTRSVQETIARMRRLMEDLRDPEARRTPP